MKKPLNILFPIFAVILGIVFVVSGIHKLATKDLYDSTVTATVVDIQEEWDTSADDNSPQTTTHVYIDYEVDGKKYEHVESPEQNGNMKIGDTVEILYQSKDPSKISTKDISKVSAIFIAAGALVAVIGGISTVRMITKK